MPRKLQKPWLQAYLEYTNDTENPISYNQWCGISALSSSLKRHVYIWFKPYRVYPNQYIILVGPPGLGKGNSMTPAVKLAREAGTVNYVSDKITVERLIEVIATGFSKPVTTSGTTLTQKEYDICVDAGELSIFLGTNTDMPQTLCRMWEGGEFEYQTRHKGSFPIKNMSLSIIAACVPEYIRYISKEANITIAGGFASRCIFVYENTKSKLIPNAWGAPNGHYGQLRQDLIEDLKHMSSQLNGEMTIDSAALPRWGVLYDKYKPDDNFESDAKQYFKARVCPHIIKTAMALSISESDDLTIKDHHLEQAAILVEKVLEDVDITFRMVGESSLAANIGRIKNFVELKGLCTKKEIMKVNHNHITDEDLERVLKTLEGIGFLTRKSIGNTGAEIIEHTKKYVIPQQHP